MKRHLIVLSVLACSMNLFGQTYFTKNNVLEDLTTLKTVLEEAHYDLFAYTSKIDFESTYNFIKNEIQPDSLTQLQTANLFQQLTSIVNNGHTYIDFPVQPYIEYIEADGTLFPLEISFENGKAYVRKNWSQNTDIAVGDEVVSINGKFVDEIAGKFYPYISAERPYFKMSKIELYSFPRYYWLVFGQQDSFRIRVKTADEVKTVAINAIHAINDFEDVRTEIFRSNRELKYFDNAAYLNPGAFSGNEQEFKNFIDSAFTNIQQNESEHLIIDLRNNTGGNNSFSDYMVSYFADKPFKWCSDFRIKTSTVLKEFIRKNNDTTTVYAQEILHHEAGESYAPEMDVYQPQDIAKRYNGTIYVLVNRLSISMASVTAAQIQDYGWGTLVGEETGEYPSLYASIFQYSLPNTGIVVNISKGKITRVNGSNKEEGLLPDILIKDHLLDEEDEILEGLLKKIGTD
jgi:C-terminal processing protease CtpA/Prc